MGDAAADEEDLRAVDGRVPGRRGRATRQRLLECTKDMLRSSSYRDLKVVEIAREAGTSPATFYQYFPDVESAVLALAEEMAEDKVRFARIVRDGSWKGRGGFDRALALADEFLAFWDDHQPILRVVDLAAEEGMEATQIARFLVLHKELDPDDDELTRTRKVRRGFIADKYAVLVDALYGGKAEQFIETQVKFEDGRTGKVSATLKIVQAKQFPPVKAAA